MSIISHPNGGRMSRAHRYKICSRSGYIYELESDSYMYEFIGLLIFIIKVFDSIIFVKKTRILLRKTAEN